MWILFKSVARFFKKSKVLLIGLIMLIFASSTIFTTLNSVSNNLYNSYDKLVTQGNLHDFVVNEKYTLGYFDYTYTKTELPNGDPTNPADTTPKIRVTINPSDPTKWTDSYKNFYDKNKDIDIYKDLLKEKKLDYYWDPIANPQNPNPPAGVINSEEYFNQTLLPEVEKEISIMKNELISLVSTFIETEFDTNVLNTLDVTYRRFKSIDVNNTKQSIFYKLIETSTNYKINNLVIYEGNNLTNPIDYNSEIFTPFLNDTNLYSRRLLDLLVRANWSNNSIINEFNAAHTYFNSPNNIHLDPYTTSASGPNSDNINKGITKMKKIFDDKQYNFKGFRINFSIPGNLPISGNIEDFSSYESVVSPSFIDKHNKSIFPLSDWVKHLNDSQKDFETWFNTIDNKFKYSIDETEYIILGAGISPDFMYPIVSFSSPIPNYDKEAIVYANKNGYERTLDAFRGNDQEEFIVGKFNNPSQANELLHEINSKSERIMSWPHGTKAAYFASDTSNSLTPTSLRLQFIPQILNLVQLVTIFLTLFIWILAIIISILVIKRFIETNKNSLGIMLANGFKKKEIVWSIVLFLAIPILSSIIFGFFFGLGLQTPAMFIFSNLWAIPINLTFFSPLSFFINVILEGLLFLIISFIFSWYTLRGNIAELMKDETKYKLSKLSIFMKKPFIKTGIMNTFRASVAFSSIWRLLLLSFMSSLVMLSFSFVLATNNKFNEAAIATYKTRNYSYALKLTTPSKEGGQYYAVPYNYSGMTLKTGTYFNISNNSGADLTNQISQNYLTSPPYNNANINFTNDQRKGIEAFGNYHLISAIGDADGQTKDLLYLKYKSQNKILIDHFLGFLGIGANPWQIVTKLMPNNQINHSNNSFRKILEKIIVDEKNTIALGTNLIPKTYREHLLDFTKLSNLNYEESQQVFADSLDPSKIQYREFDGSKIQLLRPLVLQPNFIEFFINVFLNPNYIEEQYNVMFNKIGINPSDRPFTYVDFYFSQINNKKYETSVADSIFGIHEAPLEKDNAINLINESNQIVNNKLFETDTTLPTSYMPVVINAFAAKKYDLKIGNIFKIKANNKTDRYVNTASKDIESPYTFKVVDIIKSYQNSEFFISQANANKILGLKSNIGKFDFAQSGFNGIFSFESSIPQVTNGISLYSPSGLYPGYDTFSGPGPTGHNSDVIKLLEIPTNLDKAKDITGIDATDADDFLTKLIDRYGGSSVYAVLNNVIDRDSSKSVFDTLAYTISSIQISVMATIIIITLIIVVLISTMIVFDSIKLASFLKCLGLNDKDNALSFLMIYAPVFFIGLLIALPLVYLFNFIYVEIIFKQAAILLVVNLSFLNILVPIVSILFVFFISYLLAWYKIRGTNLPQIIK